MPSLVPTCLSKMFITGHCFLCKENPEKVFYAQSTLCPGSEEPLKEVIEEFARSAKLEVHLAEDTVLCFECCKILEIFIEKKRDLLDRIEKALAFLDELDEEPIIKEENLFDTETAQDPFLESVPVKKTAFVDAKIIDNEIKLEIIEENVNNIKNNQQSPILIENEHHTRASETEKLFDKGKYPMKENRSDDEICKIEETSLLYNGSKKYKCDLCNFSHKNETRLILHKNIHKGLKETQCSRCNRTFGRLGTCMWHMEKQSECWKFPAPEHKHKCDLCDFTHENELYLILHKNIHKGLIESQCPFCPKLSSEKKYCIRHIKTMHPNIIKSLRNRKTTVNSNSSDNEKNGIEEKRKYKCDLCNYAHYAENHLILHKGTHKGLKETQCPFCFKVLAKKGHTLRHMEVHTNFEKYQCHKCGIRFSQILKFRNHRMKHDAEENPVICKICGRKFITVKTLKRHEITHRDDRPRYTCSHCGKMFVDGRAFKIHETKHGKEYQKKLDTLKPPKRQNITQESTCIICTESFTNKEQLDNHMESEHDVILKPVIQNRNQKES